MNNEHSRCRGRTLMGEMQNGLGDRARRADHPPADAVRGRSVRSARPRSSPPAAVTTTTTARQHRRRRPTTGTAAAPRPRDRRHHGGDRRPTAAARPTWPRCSASTRPAPAPARRRPRRRAGAHRHRVVLRQDDEPRPRPRRQAHRGSSVARRSTTLPRPQVGRRRGRRAGR